MNTNQWNKKQVFNRITKPRVGSLKILIKVLMKNFTPIIWNLE